jgi:hypothetical protein
MWQNNGYVNNGNFPNSFNQDDFPTSPFTGSTGVPGQQYFPPHPHPPNMMQFDNGNVEGYMSNDFQPEVGLYNERAFSQNQFASPHPQVRIGDHVFQRFVACSLLYKTCDANLWMAA